MNLRYLVELSHAERDSLSTMLSGGQHAFDTMESALTWAHVRAVRHWLEQRV